MHKCREEITFKIVRYDEHGQPEETLTHVFNGDIVLSGHINDIDVYPGLLEHFKNFASALSYPASCIERIQYLEKDEEVVEKDWGNSTEPMKSGEVVHMLKCTDDELAAYLTDPEEHIRAIAEEIYRNRKLDETIP